LDSKFLADKNNVTPILIENRIVVSSNHPNIQHSQLVLIENYVQLEPQIPFKKQQITQDSQLRWTHILVGVVSTELKDQDLKQLK